jgi:hypothetical protein
MIVKVGGLFLVSKFKNNGKALSSLKLFVDFKFYFQILLILIIGCFPDM